MSIQKTAPEGVPVLDLDKTRVARAEASKDLPYRLIHLSAGYVPVQHEVDIRCAEDFASGRITDGLKKLLVDPEDVDAIGAVTSEDLEALTEFVLGKPLGE